jgi:hypothetical protein
MAATWVENRRIQSESLARFFAGYKLIYDQAAKLLSVGFSSKDVRAVILEACQPMPSAEMANHVNDAIDDAIAGRPIRSEPSMTWLPAELRTEPDEGRPMA